MRKVDSHVKIIGLLTKVAGTRVIGIEHRRSTIDVHRSIILHDVMRINNIITQCITMEMFALIHHYIANILHYMVCVLVWHEMQHH